MTQEACASMYGPTVLFGVPLGANSDGMGFLIFNF